MVESNETNPMAATYQQEEVKNYGPAEATEEDIDGENALRDNIKRKGTNSVSYGKNYTGRIESCLDDRSSFCCLSRIFSFSLLHSLNISLHAVSPFQYYYAHAGKNFNTDGAKHFEGDGKIYGGDPVLVRTVSQTEAAMQASAAAAQVRTVP